MQGVYKRASPKEGARFQRQVLEDIQDLQETTLGLHSQLSESWEREAGMADMLTQMSEKVHFMHQKVMKSGFGNDKIDFTIINEELRLSEGRNSELVSQLTQQVADRMSQDMAQV